MNINHLSLDEIQIECEIRDIVGSSVEQFKNLTERLEDEALVNGKIEFIIHKRAMKSLKSEFNICVTKVKELKTRIENILTESAEDSVDQHHQLLQVCNSRVLYVLNRFKRIMAYSPKYLAKASSWEKVGFNLLDLINKIHERAISKDNSLSALKNLDVNTNEDLESGSEDSAYVKDSIKTEKPAMIQHRNEHDNPIQGLLESSSASQSAPPQRAVFDHFQNPLSLSSTQHIPSIRRRADGEVVDRLSEISALINEIKIDGTDRIPTARDNRTNRSGTVPLSEATQSANVYYNNKIALKPLPINQWGLTFNGKSDSISIERFLNRAEFLATQNHITFDRLSIDIVTILSGPAREYYWLILEANYPLKTSWSHLRNGMMHRFKSSLSDYDIKEVMRARKQQYGKNEPFQEFLSIILEMSLSLIKPLSELDLIHLLMENMRPGLQLDLAGETFRTVSDLENRCRAKEIAWKKIGYCPEFSNRSLPANQMRRNINELSIQKPNQCFYSHTFGSADPSAYYLHHGQPEVCTVPHHSSTAFCTSNQPSVKYHIPGVHESTVHQPEHHLTEVFNLHPEPNVSSLNSCTNSNTNEPQLRPTLNPRRVWNPSRIKCYNCEQWGHSFLDCNVSVTGDFCTSCGRKGLLKPNCPTCFAKVGNYQPGGNVIGNVHLPEATNSNPNLSKAVQQTSDPVNCQNQYNH